MQIDFIITNQNIFTTTIEERKLHIIRCILELEEESVFKTLEQLLKEADPKNEPAKSVRDFGGILSHEEAGEMLRVIEEGDGCGHPDCHFKKLHSRP